jgi:hypothetical protein
MLFHFRNCQVFLVHRLCWWEIMVSEKKGQVILGHSAYHIPTLMSPNGISWISMGFSSNILCSASSLIHWDLTKLCYTRECMWGLQPTPHKTAGSQNSLLLHNLCCRVCEPQLSYIDASAAVLLHFVFTT